MPPTALFAFAAVFLAFGVMWSRRTRQVSDPLARRIGGVLKGAFFVAGGGSLIAGAVIGLVHD